MRAMLRRPGTLRCSAAVALVACCITYDVRARQIPLPERPAWIGFFSEELVEWVENPNRLEALCAPFKAVAPRFEECRSEKLEPKPLVVELRNGPSAAAAGVGQLILIATPG